MTDINSIYELICIVAGFGIFAGLFFAKMDKQQWHFHVWKYDIRLHGTHTFIKKRKCSICKEHQQMHLETKKWVVIEYPITIQRWARSKKLSDLNDSVGLFD